MCLHLYNQHRLNAHFENISVNTTPILSSIPVNHCFIISHPKALGLLFYFAHGCHEAGIQGLHKVCGLSWQTPGWGWPDGWRLKSFEGRFSHCMSGSRFCWFTVILTGTVGQCLCEFLMYWLSNVTPKETVLTISRGRVAFSDLFLEIRLYHSHCILLVTSKLQLK